MQQPVKAQKPLAEAFRRAAQSTAKWMGSAQAFVIALAGVLAWAAVGPALGYSQNWQLVINTGTTIITFLMVILIQNTQNRDAMAIHLKLDELIRAVKGAKNERMDLDCLSDQEMDELKKKYDELAHRPEPEERG